MDYGQELAAHLESIGIQSGPRYVERDANAEETGRYWVTTDIGLCSATVEKNDHGNQTFEIRITPWAALGDVTIAASGVLAGQSGPSRRIEPAAATSRARPLTPLTAR